MLSIRLPPLGGLSCNKDEEDNGAIVMTSLQSMIEEREANAAKKARAEEKLKGEIKGEISKIKMGIENQLPEDNILKRLSHTRDKFPEIKQYFSDHPSALEDDDNESVLIGEFGIDIEDMSHVA